MNLLNGVGFKKSKFFILLVIFLVFAGFEFRKFRLASEDQNQPEINPFEDTGIVNNPTSSEKPEDPANSAFEELTIPYLRQRNYQSDVGNLEALSQNSSYISYLTSYTSDQIKINALLTRPKGEAPEDGWPAIIFIHGYIPPSRYQTSERYEEYVDYLARNGFVVFKIDLRGHGESEGEPNGAYYSSDYVIDTLSAYVALQNLDIVNPNKIGLWGHSMAGNIILRSLVVKPDIPAAVVWAGTVFTYQDFVDYGIDDDSYQPPSQDAPRRSYRRALFETHGSFDLESDFWSKVSPLNYLPDIKSEIQLHHAINDSVAPIDYSRNIKNYLDNSNVSVELHEYAQGGHNISSPDFSLAMQQTVDFFITNLRKR